MKYKSILRNIAAFSSISALITAATYFVNAWLLSGNKQFSPTEALFVEGIVFVLAGLLLLLGRGGINLASQKAAVLATLTGTGSPSEIFRRDKWKPQGFIRSALILIVAGVLTLLTYFLTL